jgi:hypothetical protein
MKRWEVDDAGRREGVNMRKFVLDFLLNFQQEVTLVFTGMCDLDTRFPGRPKFALAPNICGSSGALNFYSAPRFFKNLFF